MGAIYVGTSGWSYSHWKGKFYPSGIKSKDWLKFYSTQFNTVEINSTFYRLPKVDTVVSWRQSVDAKFLFAVKMSKVITHTKRLKEIEEPLRVFIELCNHFGNCLGPILVQLPPGLKKDLDLLNSFLEAIPKKFMIAIEFRNKTWFDDDVYSLLHNKSTIFCWHDYSNIKVPKVITSDSIYVRMHGPSGRYYGSYPEDFLRELANEILKQDTIRETYVYFNNDADGHAVENALSLKKYLSSCST